MKPYVLEDRRAEHPKWRDMGKNERRRSAKKRREEVRERRKHDKKALRDEWEF